jgi:hypothetical protein
MRPSPRHRCEPKDPTLESFPRIFPLLSVERLFQFVEFLEQAFGGWALRGVSDKARKEDGTYGDLVVWTYWFCHLIDSWIGSAKKNIVAKKKK